MTDQKTGWLARLLGLQKAQKTGGCCSYTIEEIPEEGAADEALDQSAPAGQRPSCCGPAFDLSRGDAKGK